MAIQNVGFFGMLHGIYGAVAALASAAQRGANALDNLGQWAEEQTGSFVDEARMDRQEKIEVLKRKREESRLEYARSTATQEATVVTPRNEVAA